MRQHKLHCAQTARSIRDFALIASRKVALKPIRRKRETFPRNSMNMRQKSESVPNPIGNNEVKRMFDTAVNGHKKGGR